MERALRLSFALLLLGACGSSSGTRPEDASAAEHEAMARAEERAAGAHGSYMEEPPEIEPAPCDRGRGGCWSSTRSPTEEHARAAERHRKLAAEHRAASRALIEAEQKACQGVSAENRDMSPFFHREDIASVRELVVPIQIGKSAFNRTVGAIVAFRAQPGMTAEWLQRVVDCHIARAAALGHDVPEMDYCPLVLKGVDAKVRSSVDGFEVELRSDDPDTAREILRRARALKTPSPDEP